VACFALVTLAAGGCCSWLARALPATMCGLLRLRSWPPSCWGEVIHTVFVERRMGVDTIALVAMLGSLALGEYLAGMIVGLMFSGGGALEDWASSRAKRELTELIQRAPKVAQLRRGDTVEEVPVDQVRAGDVVLVRTGEVGACGWEAGERRGGAGYRHT